MAKTSTRSTKLLGPFVIDLPFETRWNVKEVSNHWQTFGTRRKGQVRRRVNFALEIEQNKNDGRQNGESI